MITKINFIDDPNNTTFENRQVTYEAIIIGGPKEGQILQNVKAMNEYGGEFNFSEKIYRPINTKNISDLPISEHVGDIVYVGFLQGYTRAPVIIGAGDQPNDTSLSGATSKDGLIDHKQYNGIYQAIDKNGNWIIQRKGGTYDSDSISFVPNENANLASIQLIDQKVIHAVGNNVSSTMDGATEKITVVFKSGMTVTLDGKADSAKIKTAAGGEINIVKEKIAIGNGTAELFDQLSKALDKLSTFFQSKDATHDHIGNLGYPSSPPETASDFVQIGTDLAAIKALIDAIKGSL